MQGKPPTTPSFQELADQFRAKEHSVEPKTAEAVLNADLKNAEDIKVPETPEFFNPAYSTTDQGENDIIDDATKAESGFTVDEPLKPKEPNKFLNVDWKKPINILPGKPVDYSLENRTPDSEKQIGKIEQMQLRVNLRNAVDQFNKITAQAARLVADIENKGGNEGEIPRINITQVLEDPRLHDPRVSSSVKSRFLHELTEKLKNENSKVETDQYKNVLQEIEPAKTEVSKALEALLVQTKNSLDVKRIRTTLADIIFETNETISFKQDLEAICINKEAELEEQLDKSKNNIDQLPNVSNGIVDNINKIGERKENEGLSVDSNQLSVGDKDAATERIEPAQPAEPKFEEFVKFGPDGNKASEDTTKHEEVSLSPTNGDINSAVLSNLKRGDGESNETGVVNLTMNDLDNQINPTHEIRARVEAIKNTPQNLPTGSVDMFGSDNSDNSEPIRDVNNTSIDQPGITNLFENKTSVLAEPPVSVGTSPDGSLGGKVVQPKEIQGAQELPEPETLETPNKELKIIEEVKPSADIPITEKGPDLVAEPQNMTEPIDNIPAANSKTEPALRKSGLAVMFNKFLHLNHLTADSASKLEQNVGSIRAATTEKLAEQKEK